MQSPNVNDRNSNWTQAHQRLVIGHVSGERRMSDDARQAVWEIVATLADFVTLDTTGTLGAVA